MRRHWLPVLLILACFAVPAMAHLAINGTELFSDTDRISAVDAMTVTHTVTASADTDAALVVAATLDVSEEAFAVTNGGVSMLRVGEDSSGNNIVGVLNGDFVGLTGGFRCNSDAGCDVGTSSLAIDEVFADDYLGTADGTWNVGSATNAAGAVWADLVDAPSGTTVLGSDLDPDTDSTLSLGSTGNEYLGVFADALDSENSAILIGTGLSIAGSAVQSLNGTYLRPSRTTAAEPANCTAPVTCNASNAGAFFYCEQTDASVSKPGGYCACLQVETGGGAASYDWREFGAASVACP